MKTIKSLRPITLLLMILLFTLSAYAERWVITDRDLTIWGDLNYINRLGVEHAGYEFDAIGRDGNKLIFMYNGKHAYVADYCCRRVEEAAPAPEPVPAPDQTSQPSAPGNTDNKINQNTDNRQTAAQQSASQPNEQYPESLEPLRNYLIENEKDINKSLAIIMVLVFLVLYIGGLTAGAIYVWRKYKKWKTSSLCNVYNRYNALPYLISALIIFLTPLLSPLYLFWWLPKIEEMLLYDRRQKYWGTLILSLSNIIAVSLGVGLLVSGLATPFIGLPVGIIVFFWRSILAGTKQAYKCPRCSAVDTTKFIGEFDGGIDVVNSNDVSSMTEERPDGVDEITKSTYNKSYYQRKKRVYVCGECGEQWERTFRDRFLGADTRTETTTREFRF